MDAWIRLGLSAFSLGMEANQVIAYRLMRLASGAGGRREVRRMISEKFEAMNSAGIVAAGSAARGETMPATLEGVLRSYRKRVRRNARRLKRQGTAVDS